MRHLWAESIFCDLNGSLIVNLKTDLTDSYEDILILRDILVKNLVMHQTCSAIKNHFLFVTFFNRNQLKVFYTFSTFCLRIRVNTLIPHVWHKIWTSRSTINC